MKKLFEMLVLLDRRAARRSASRVQMKWWWRRVRSPKEPKGMIRRLMDQIEQDPLHGEPPTVAGSSPAAAAMKMTV